MDYEKWNLQQQWRIYLANDHLYTMEVYSILIHPFAKQSLECQRYTAKATYSNIVALMQIKWRSLLAQLVYAE